VGIAANLGLAVLKAAAGVFGHSYALIADAAESAADVLTSTAILLALRFATKPADEDHPHGHGKAEPLASVFVSLALFAAAAWIAVGSARMIVTPHRLPAPFTLVVLVGVLIVKEFLFRYASHIGKAVGSPAVQADAVHQRSDVFVSGAAFVGITIALIGGKGYESADDWAALAASAVIAYGAFTLLSKSVSELLDTAAPLEITDRIRTLAAEVEGVRGTDKCLVRKTGMDLLVELDVLVDGEVTVTRAHTTAHAVQDHIRAEMPQVARVIVHTEPSEG
jgi:cation diffusion facilitator family transporter